MASAHGDSVPRLGGKGPSERHSGPRDCLPGFTVTPTECGHCHDRVHGCQCSEEGPAFDPCSGLLAVHTSREVREQGSGTPGSTCLD